VFNGFITLGQAIFAIGMTLSEPSMRWPVMYVGRIIFGFGGESLSVAQSAIIAKWFVGKELALGTFGVWFFPPATTAAVRDSLP
jgi:MFS family permease